jgi:hypothetical protein
MSSQSFLSDQPELMQLAIEGILVLLGLYLLIAFLRLFTRSGLESRVRSYDGGCSGDDGKRGEAQLPSPAAGGKVPSANGAARTAASDE